MDVLCSNIFFSGTSLYCCSDCYKISICKMADIKIFT